MSTTIAFHPRMSPNRPDHLNSGRTLTLSLAFLTVLLAWAYFNLKVPLLLNDILPDFPGKDTVKGLIMAMDNLLALLLQPVFGAWSDRTASRHGRRMPYIVLGTFLSALFFVVIPWARVLWAFVLVVFLFNLSMSLYRTAALVIMPDYTPDSVRPRGSAIQQFTANMGGVIGFAIPIALGMVHLPGRWNDAAGFVIVSALMLVLLLLQILLIRETPTGSGRFSLADRPFDLDPVTLRATAGGGSNGDSSKGAGAEAEQRAAISQILDAVKHDKSFRFFLGAVFFWYLGFAAVEAFFSSFAVTYLGKASDAEAGRLFLAYSIPMILSAYFVGLVGQRYGRKRAVVGFLVVLVSVLGVFSAAIVPASYKNANDLVVMIFLAMIAIPWMGVIVNSFPLLWSLAGETKVGTYTGIYYTFNQSAYSLSPVLMGLVLSTASAVGDYRYIVMFPFVFLCFLTGLILVVRVRYKDDH